MTDSVPKVGYEYTDLMYNKSSEFDTTNSKSGKQIELRNFKK